MCGIAVLADSRAHDFRQEADHLRFTSTDLEAGGPEERCS